MGYSRFSTGNADYAQVYKGHYVGTKADIFDKGKISSLDAVLVENCGADHRVLELDSSGLGIFPQWYESLTKASHEAGKPIYLVDTNITLAGKAASLAINVALLYVCLKSLKSSAKDLGRLSESKMKRRDFVKGIGKAAAGFFLLNAFVGSIPSWFTESEHAPVLEEAAAAAHRFPPDPVLEVRNCIIARKTEEFVVPLLREKLGRKPNIALVFGSYHAGLAGCLKHKWWRDSVLGSYARFNYPGIVSEDLNKVLAILPLNGETRDDDFSGYNLHFICDDAWFTKEYNCGLFQRSLNPSHAF